MHCVRHGIMAKLAFQFNTNYMSKPAEAEFLRNMLVARLYRMVVRERTLGQHNANFIYGYTQLSQRGRY